MNDTPPTEHGPEHPPVRVGEPEASSDQPSKDESGSLWEGSSKGESRASEQTAQGVSGQVFNQMLGRRADQSQDQQPDLSEDQQPVTTSHQGQPPAIVRLVDVYKSFGSLKVLQGINLEIRPGQTTVIIGPSGTGKSVLLKIICGLLKPDRGQVWFNDQRVDLLPEKKLVAVRKKMGMLFQMGALFDSMTVKENITFPLLEHNHSMSAAVRLERCRTMLKIVGLKDVENKTPGDLSGGQRKRVALARAIILEPDLVLYDEPTTGLDPIRSDVINELILGLTRQLGITSIVVTHDMVSADKIADRMVMLYDGKVIIDGSPTEFHQTDNDLVKRFIRGQADQAELTAIREGIEPVAKH